jgi:hypothetical protein
MKNKVQQLLSNMLQREICLQCNNKIIKQGKLINFTTGDYVVTLLIRNAKKQLKSYDLYHPYDIEYRAPDDFTFDYTLDTLTTGQSALHDMIDSAMSLSDKNHKLYNNRMHVTAV